MQRGLLGLIPCFKQEPEMIDMAMGNLDGDADHPPGYHFFVDSKADWVEICDGLPPWGGMPKEEGSCQIE